MCSNIILLQQASEDGDQEATPEAEAAQPLSEQEEKEKAALLDGGFKDWARRDFNAFVRACEKVSLYATRFTGCRRRSATNL